MHSSRAGAALTLALSGSQLADIISRDKLIKMVNFGLGNKMSKVN